VPTYYITTLNIAIPLFVSLILFEIVYAKIIDKGYVIRSMDTLSSLCSGLTNVIRDVLGLTIVIISYSYMVENFAIFKIETSWLLYLIAFIGLDFAGYWVHRINHSINYFWNHHIIHHSSEEFNLACALRQSISNFFSLTFIFLIPTAIIGVPAEVITFLAPIHLFAQYWYHTRLIDKLGFLEYIIVTPSHHRVHHAINDEYLDKNLSQIFIIWDKLFGTFQEELEDVPPVYGVKRPLRSWNPILINFSHLFQLIKDAWRTNSILDKFRIWFMPTGWRPQDVNKKYPVTSIDSPNDYKKYYPKLSLKLQTWSWIQYLLVFFFMMYFINNLHRIGFYDGALYAIFLYISIYSLTSLMDQDSFAWLFEIGKATLGMYFIITYGDWFYITDYFDYATIYLMAYFVISSLVVIYFSVYEKKLNYISN
tara:strand:+ start:466 stop:1734 length:1269 start_codon:yes stop_codon:yes gene_type:complete